MVLFKTVYIYLYNLGLFTENIIKSVFRYFFGFIPNLFEKSDRKHFSREKIKALKKLAFRAGVVVVAAVLVFTAVLVTSSGDRKVDACRVLLDGEVIGYVETEAEGQFVEGLVKNETASETLSLTYENTKADPCDINSTDSLFETLITRAFPEFERVCNIYIGGTYLCSVTDIQSAKKTFDDLLQKAQKQYPNSAVSFSQDVTFRYGYKKSGDENIWDTEKVLLSIKTLNLLSVQHVECEKEMSPLDYETVEIETNTLFIGDSRVRREGKDGKEYVISLVTYNGDKKVLSQHLTSVTVTAPVSQVIERGMRAESLSMGSYTVTQTSGYFCWPVVGLYNVTSNYGYRSLGYHHGIDISGANASGSLVVAGASGTIVEAGWSTGGYGNYVIIDHGNGVETLYGHMLDNSLMVSAGMTVTKGQALGRVGNTGYSFGAHLHFEVRINGTRVNPARYLGLE